MTCVSSTRPTGLWARNRVTNTHTPSIHQPSPWHTSVILSGLEKRAFASLVRSAFKTTCVHVSAYLFYFNFGRNHCNLYSGLACVYFMPGEHGCIKDVYNCTSTCVYFRREGQGMVSEAVRNEKYQTLKAVVWPIF